MMETRHEISVRQFFTFIFSAQIGIGLLSLPSTLAQSLGHDGWISVLIAGLLSALIFVVIGKLMLRFKDKSIYDIDICLFGKTAGYILNILIVAYLIFAAILGIRFFTEVIKIMALKSTPNLILTVFIMLPTIYMSLYGLRIIGRFSCIIIPITLLVIVFLLMNLSKIHPTFLMPVGEAGVNKIFSGLFDSFFAFVGLELVIVTFPYVKEKEQIVKWGVLACLVSTLVFTFVTAFTTAFFGEEMVKSLSLPLFNLSRCYKSDVFERVDLFFTMLWFPAMAISLRTYFFTGYQSICRLIGNKKPAVTLGLYSVVLILASRLPKNMTQIHELSNVLSICTILLLIYLFLCFGIAMILKKKG